MQIVHGSCIPNCPQCFDYSLRVICEVSKTLSTTYRLRTRQLIGPQKLAQKTNETKQKLKHLLVRSVKLTVKMFEIRFWLFGSNIETAVQFQYLIMLISFNYWFWNEPQYRMPNDLYNRKVMRPYISLIYYTTAEIYIAHSVFNGEFAICSKRAYYNCKRHKQSSNVMRVDLGTPD